MKFGMYIKMKSNYSAIFFLFFGVRRIETIFFSKKLMKNPFLQIFFALFLKNPTRCEVY